MNKATAEIQYFFSPPGHWWGSLPTHEKGQVNLNCVGLSLWEVNGATGEKSEIVDGDKVEKGNPGSSWSLNGLTQKMGNLNLRLRKCFL